MQDQQFEWDEHKNTRNKAKHSISFETAVLVFDDIHHKSILASYKDGEERWQTLGMIAGVAVILVAHTYRDIDGGTERIRIISARKATKFERGFYERTD